MKKLVAIVALGVFTFSCGSDEWNDDTRKKFMDTCSKSLSEDVCKCSLDKIEKDFKPSDMDKKDDDKVVEGIKNAMTTCMGL